MNGQTMNYKRYFESLENMKEPVVPRAKIDMRGFLAYAKKIGKSPAEISKEDKDKFIVYK